jgi:hypothetical protein
MAPGESREVLVYAQVNSWEVWIGSLSGTIEPRNSQSWPCVSSGITFSASGDGTVMTPSSPMTDGNGIAIGIFTMGTGASTVTAEVAGATGSVTFDTPIIPETWTWDHDESLISASLGTTDGTENVPCWVTRPVQAYVEYSSWSVYVSNFGHTETRDYGTSPAIGAQVSWSLAGGDGSVDQLSSTTDSSGNAWVNFTMGAGDSVLRADVTYATSTTTCATLAFSAAENWTFDHIENVISSFAFGADGNTDGLTPGTQRTATVNVACTSYEVWVSNRGNMENRNESTGPALWMNIDFTLDYGDGSLSVASAMTDANGNASVTFTMGDGGSRLRASAGNSASTIDFSTVPETWNYQGQGGALSFGNFSADGPAGDVFPGETRTLGATVGSNSWEVWTSNLGNTEYRNYSSNVGSGVTVGFTVESGDGTVSAAGNSTDWSGLASVGFTMGSSTSTVRADMADGNGGVTSTWITLTAHVPQWAHVRDETVISTTVTTADGLTSLEAGAARTVTAQVLYTSWEVWQDDLGNVETRNPASGAAHGAAVAFSVDQGDGVISEAGAGTDANGNASATFTMGSEASRVRVDADYATATSIGTLDFTPEVWDYHSAGSSVHLTLSADASTVTAGVSVTTWDVYTNGTVFENRNISSFPAGNAAVTFSGGGCITGLEVNPVYTDIGGQAVTAYTRSYAGMGSVTATAYFMGASETVSLEIAPGSDTDTDGDGIPDYVEIQFGLDPSNPNDAGQLRYLNGVTDGLSVLQAFQRNCLHTLQPGATGAVAVCLSSSVTETGYDSGGGPTGIFATTSEPASGGGTEAFYVFTLDEEFQSHEGSMPPHNWPNMKPSSSSLRSRRGHTRRAGGKRTGRIRSRWFSMWKASRFWTMMAIPCGRVPGRPPFTHGQCWITMRTP